MRPIHYYVATSIDGYICGPEEDVSGFLASGPGVDRYLEDLKAYDTVIMGRRTYEFGYQFGLKPGQLPYPHMKHYVFSETVELKEKDENLIITPLDLHLIDQIKAEEGSPVYLCGGGRLAGWLLAANKIDRIILKLNPFIQGNGVKLFEKASKNYSLALIDSVAYEDGLQILTYDVVY